MYRYGTTEKFLLACVRANSEGELQDVARRFSGKFSSISWSNVINYRPTLAASIYSRLKQCCKDFAVPRRISKIIELRYLSTVSYNKKLLHEATGIARACEAADLEIIFLKGSALLMTIYKNDIGMRQLVDIDVLVKKKDLPKAENIIRSIGYAEDYERLQKEERATTSLSREYWTKKHFHYHYYKKDIKLELHWDIQVPCNEALLEKIFESRTIVRANETKTTILNPGAELFIACYNLIKDVNLSQVLSNRWRGNNVDRTYFFYTLLSFFYNLKNILQGYRGKDSFADFISLVKLTGREYDFFTLLLIGKKVVNTDIPQEIMFHMRRNIFVLFFHLLAQLPAYGRLETLFVLRELYRAPRHAYHAVRSFGRRCRSMTQKVFVK